MKGRILVVDDEANIRSALAKLLSKFGHSVESAGTAEEALRLLQPGRYRVVLTDLRMPGTDGLSLLRQIKAVDGSVEVIVMTAFGTVDTAVEAMREGAYDYIEKPINQERLPILLDRVLEKQALAEDNSRLREAVKTQDEFGGLIGKTEKMARVYQFIEMVAPTGATVLIQGESGVGKELIARAIHQRSTRSQGPLISLNCGAIPESLLESELFGFEKGAFTGADTARQGKIEMSDKGTLFLDEVGEMHPKTQIELLRVLETKELRRLGGSKLISVDLRVVAATNKKLSDEVAAGKIPGRSLLSTQCGADLRSPTPRTARRYTLACGAVSSGVRRKIPKAAETPLSGSDRAADGASVAWQRPGTQKSDGAPYGDRQRYGGWHGRSARGVSSRNDLAAHDGNPHWPAAGEGRGNDHSKDAQRGHIAPGKSSSHSRNQPKGSALQTAPLWDR